MKKTWPQRLALLALSCLLCGPGGATAQPTQNDTLVVDARDANAKRDKDRLAALRAQALAQNHPLASWVDYWELNNRLGDAQQPELDAFYARWRGTYVEDRLRNDWLLELGRRRDWAGVAKDHPAFRMQDDRQVACYALLAEHNGGRNVRDSARSAWLAQREPDDGCALLAQTLYEAGQFGQNDVWKKLRLSAEFGRAQVARQAAAVLGPATAATVGQIFDQPAKFLSRNVSTQGRAGAELTALAIARMAANDPEAAAGQLDRQWERKLPPDLAGWAWAITAKQSAMKLLPEAHAQFQRAAARARKAGAEFDWTDDTQAWRARAALRALQAPQRWEILQATIGDMSAEQQRDATWVYWKARALQEQARENPPEAEALRTQARLALESIASPLHFYGQLAAEDLRLPLAMPPAPVPLTAAESEAAQQHPGLARAMLLIGLGLRNEGVREWNYSLRGMGERELLAAAQVACEREIWDRCINTSDRSKQEIDIAQRYPRPFRDELEGKAREIGLDPAYVYGLVRQESRFVIDARSSVGASGLMQIMPSTARWTAKKIGMPFAPEMITSRDVNLKLGTAYLKLVLDNFGGSQAMAAAAYNAGPSRPRRWREGPLLETAIWAENIPFNETRDYVKRVLANATVYASLLGDPRSSLKQRLGRGIGPREPAAPEPDGDIP
jgi:soluble lytic murein transglycosylase